MTNIEVAIYTKLNELAARHGLKPHDFVAVLKKGPGPDQILDFEWPAEGNELRAYPVNPVTPIMSIARRHLCLE